MEKREAEFFEERVGAVEGAAVDAVAELSGGAGGGEGAHAVVLGRANGERLGRGRRRNERAGDGGVAELPGLVRERRRERLGLRAEDEVERRAE